MSDKKTVRFIENVEVKDYAGEVEFSAQAGDVRELSTASANRWLRRRAAVGISGSAALVKAEAALKKAAARLKKARAGAADKEILLAEKNYAKKLADCDGIKAADSAS